MKILAVVVLLGVSGCCSGNRPVYLLSPQIQVSPRILCPYPSPASDVARDVCERLTPD